jgi:uncharacterized MAPEG superfamily protein
MIYVPYIAIVAAFALIYLPRAVVTVEMSRLEGGYNNNDPRGQQAQLAGRGRRALAAHHNAGEAFAPFAAGVLAALQRSTKVDAIAWICIAFVVVRSVFMAAYLSDKATLRSSMWALGMLCITGLMVLAIIG